MARTECRYFNGYKPCGRSAHCDLGCTNFAPRGLSLLVIHLEALGAVVRATSILPAIKRKFPQSHITWVTQAPAQQLLLHNPYIDRVLTTHSNDLLALQALEFDVSLVVDKSLRATGVLKHTRAELVYGFVANSSGAILPATPAAQELWELGLDDHRKFFVNQKPETQLLIESLELGPYCRDPYVLRLSDDERNEADRRRGHWSGRGERLIGLNTGCSATLPNKKLSIQNHRDLIALVGQLPNVKVVLLGGPEDTERNQMIGEGLPVIVSPTDMGLRDGLVSVAACDLVVTGDSLGMHMAIGLEKWVVAWFGPTCAQEIDLYDRGVRVVSAAECGPCWKRSCHQIKMCYDQVALHDLILGIQKGLQWLTSSTRQPLSATSSSASPCS